jgi:branched-chain amino acid transport system ATP-binding protein
MAAGLALLLARTRTGLAIQAVGAAPNVVDRLIDVIKQINDEGTALLLVEQDVRVALDAADRAYVLENGQVALSGLAAEVKDDRGVRRAYLGL